MKNEINDIYGQLYTQLLRQAAGQLRRDPRASLSPSSLVHEAWARLCKQPELAQHSPEHFKAIAARQMRQILIDTARKRLAERRGGKDRVSVTMNTAHGADSPMELSLEELYDLDAGLRELAARKPRLEAVAELFFFAGCTIAEIAQEVGMSESAVDRDLRYLREWLRKRLSK